MAVRKILHGKPCVICLLARFWFGCVLIKTALIAEEHFKQNILPIFFFTGKANCSQCHPSLCFIIFKDNTRFMIYDDCPSFDVMWDIGNKQKLISALVASPCFTDDID